MRPMWGESHAPDFRRGCRQVSGAIDNETSISGNISGHWVGAAATGEAVPVTPDAWGVLAARRHDQATSEARGGKNTLDCANRRGPVAASDMLGGVTRMRRRIRNEAPSLLDVVALLKDLSAQGLMRGPCR
jgi:hypothetical protein